MKIHYLGTAAAEGIPAIFCNCEVCRNARLLGGRNVRTRAQVLIDDELSIDFPPDAYFHKIAGGVAFCAIKYLLVTHSHADHFHAGDLIFRGGGYAHSMNTSTLDIYANREVLDVFAEATRREMTSEVRAGIHLHEVAPFQKIEFGGYTVHTLKAQHSSEDPLVYAIEKGGKRILHLYDTGTLLEENLDYLKREVAAPFDLVTFDCTYLWGETRPGARHMGLDENMRVLARMEAAGLADGRTKKVITHFSHNSAPTFENLARAEREFGVIAAYDGMRIEI